MSHDFELPRRRYERRTCKRCGGVYSALHVETGMVTPCLGEPVPPPFLDGRSQPRQLRQGDPAFGKRVKPKPAVRTRPAMDQA